MSIQENTYQFYEWNYDEGVVILYQRLGDCNSCGDCCTAAIRFAVAGAVKPGLTPWEENANGGAMTNGEGVWAEVRVNGERRYFQQVSAEPGASRCTNLTEDNRCAIHASKPLFHKAWPITPRQMASFTRCSYSFREIARWPLADLKPADEQLVQEKPSIIEATA
jgi:hypothetical protein